MNMRRPKSSVAYWLSLLFLHTGLVGIAHAAPLSVGPAAADPSTVCCIGISLPILSGDEDYDAFVGVSYRRTGDTAWTPALPMLRVRPETLGNEDPPENFGLPRPVEQFAGSVFDLEPGTAYDVRLQINDPDGSSEQQIIAASTQALPVDAPQTARLVAVASTTELNSALAGANPGDVIELAAGSYNGTLRIARSGTRTDPIIVTGVDQQSVTIDATGATYGIQIEGSHVYVRRLSVRNSEWGAIASNVTGAVLQDIHFSNINKGIYAKSGSNRDFYICDNILEGNGAVWPDVSRETWGLEGITITGPGHTGCHNRLSGFGDSLGLANDTDIPNLAIDFFGNDIVWGGDDGIELDFSHRNVRAFRNRVVNSGMGVSTQPAWGGPIYIVRNVLVNTAHSPYKLNNDPSGILIYHNTSVRTVGDGNYLGSAWPQFGGVISNLQFKNNLSLGTTPAQVTSDIVLGEIDYNGWSPDGQFTLSTSWPDFQALQQGSGYSANGRILTGQVFQNGPQLGADYTTFVSSADGTLQSTSNAVDAGIALANINDDFAGNGADLGALERGRTTPVYGPRENPGQGPQQPMAPTNLIAQ